MLFGGQGTIGQSASVRGASDDGDFQLKALIGHSMPFSAHIIETAPYHDAGNRLDDRACFIENLLTLKFLQIASGPKVSMI